MQLQGKTFTYEWIDNWGNLNSDDGSSHAHHDVAIDSAGRIFMSFPTQPYLRVFTPDGELLESFDYAGPQMHCLFISKDADGEWLWAVNLAESVLSKATLKGEVVASIGRDAFNIGDDEKFRFTACTVDAQTNNVWVTDGYGGYKIYCFSPELKLLTSFDCSAMPSGVLKEPHWIYADSRRGAGTEIYIADRRNHRLVVVDGSGNFLRTVEGGFNTPSALGSFGEYLVVPELEARLLILDKDDKVVDIFCDGSAYTKEAGWPNRKKGDEGVSPVPVIEQGKFNSPHGVAVDSDGNIYMHEWLKGARVTKLKRVK